MCYLRTITAIIILSLSAINLHAELMDAETLLSLKSVRDYHLSPDGKHLLYNVRTPDIKENTSRNDLYLINIDGTGRRRLTSGGTNNYSPCWSPDGKKIAFISDRSGSAQIHVMNIDGGEASQITMMEHGVGNLLWSPDGKYFSFTSKVKLEKTMAERHEDMPKANVLLYDDLPVRHWDKFTDEYYSHLFIIPVEGGEAKDLMKGEKYDVPLQPFGGRSQICWSPESSEIAYTCKKVDDPEMSTNSDIYVIPISGTKAHNITEGMTGYDLDPVYTPDNKHIAFVSMQHPGYESDKQRLFLYNRRNARIEEITKDFKYNVNHPVFSKDGQNVYFYAGNSDGTYQIWNIDLKSKNSATLTEGNYNWGDRGLLVTPDGNDLILSRRNFNHSEEIFNLNLKTKKLTQLTFENSDVMKKIDQVKIEAKWITSTDGAKVHCWVIYPPDFDASKKYPLLTYCQGGPQQMVSQHFSTGWSFLTMASKGYVIIAPNRRGCPGFGQDWTDAINQDYHGQPMQDILAATDEMLQEPYIDKNRTAAIGASAGGYAVFWLAGNHEGRFKAFISHCGMFNMISKYGSTEELWFPNWDNGGPYWENNNLEYYTESSPHTYADKWDTPILIITGEKDFRVPYTQSLEAFTVAQSKGIPSRLLYYPNENHWILGLQEKVIWYREFFDFLKTYCK